MIFDEAFAVSDYIALTRFDQVPRFSCEKEWPSEHPDQAIYKTMRKITRENNLLSCDVFSLDRERQPLGTQEFCLLDTVTWEWEGTR